MRQNPRINIFLMGDQNDLLKLYAMNKNTDDGDLMQRFLTCGPKLVFSMSDLLKEAYLILR